MTQERALPSMDSVNHVRLYAGMVETLEKEMDGKALGELFSALRASGESRSLPLAEDEDVQRLWIRYGLIPSEASPAMAGKMIEELIRAMAEATSRSHAQVSIVLRLFASGMYGVMPAGICASPPRCRACGICKDCNYHNAPPSPRSRGALSPAQRLLREGEDALPDDELVALLIGGQRTGEREKEIARTLLERYGSLRALAMAPQEELASLRDITESMVVRLETAFAFYRRTLQEKRFIGATVRSGKDFFDIYAPLLRDLRKEVFYVILLDQKNRILREERVSEGTLTASLVHPREVFAPAVRASAAAVAFVHNHPSGDSTPSPDDRNLTKRLCEAAELFGIRVLDHVVVGEGCYTSFVDEGLL